MSADPVANALWIGGPAAAGKTTVARLLARRHGLRWYSTDAHSRAHEQRAAAAGLHEMGTGPGTFDRGPMIRDDLRRLPWSPLVVVEGAFVTPAIAPHGVWLMPSEAGQRARLQRRHPDGVPDGLEYGWQLISDQLHGAEVTRILVDGQTVDQTLATVEVIFADALRRGPTASSTEQLRALIRYGNQVLLEQAATSVRAGMLAATAVRTFDCECGDPDCSAFVDLSIEAALTGAPITAHV